jgi:dolichyl-phosphate beta-glucosyltransferase
VCDRIVRHRGFVFRPFAVDMNSGNGRGNNFPCSDESSAAEHCHRSAYLQLDRIGESPMTASAQGSAAAAAAEALRQARGAGIPLAAVRTPVDIEVVIPAYNESSRLPATLAEMASFLTTQPWRSRIVVVDNGSSDDTSAIAGALSHASRTVEVVAIGCAEAGKGAAVLRGLRTSSARFVGFTDADRSTPIVTLLAAVAALQGGAAAAIASRHAPGATYAVRQTFTRRMGGHVFRTVARPLVPGVRDTQCGFKFFDRAAVDHALLATRATGFAFDVELLRRIHDDGGSIVELPVTWTDTPGSTLRPMRDGLAAVAAVGRMHRMGRRPVPQPAPDRSAFALQPAMSAAAGTDCR